MDEDAIASLQEVGLSLYEARLYLGLLVNGAQNGNELSRTSGVPSSKVYSTLDKLVASGIVEHRQRGTSAEYVCVSPEELVRRLRAKYSRPLDHLEAALPGLAGPASDTDLLRIVGDGTILDQARALIDGAAEELYVSAWAEKVEALGETLAAADRRGVRIFMMTFGGAELDVGFRIEHSDDARVAARIGGHMLTIVADGCKTLIAHVPDRGEPSGVVTENPVLCLVTEEYLRHDLVLEKAKGMPGFDEWDNWLQSDDYIRAIRLGRALAAVSAPESKR